jgi:hypothetical protein
MNTINRDSDQFLLDAYTGKGGFLSGAYLVRHTRETDDRFKERQQKAEYPNYVRKIVNIYSGYLFQRQAARETSGIYDEFARNADGAGTSIDTLMQSYQRLAMLLGTVYLIVDRPSGQAQTRADQSAPYLAVRMPSELTAYTTDAAGRFTACTFSETVDGKVRYRHFDSAGWKVTEDPEGQQPLSGMQGAYTLGRPPVVRLHSTTPLLPTDVRATPWAHDIAQTNWSLYNKLSKMDELFDKQVFSILTIPIVDTNEAERLQDMTVSTENAITFNPAGGGKPDYISPAADPVELFLKAIDATVQRIYELANLEFVGGVASSGVERSYQFMQANRGMVEMATLTEQAEIEVATLVSLWQGGTWDGMIAYPRDFALADLATELRFAMDSESLGISATFDQEIKKRVARQMLGHNVAQATMEQIDAEIEAESDPYGDRAAREAGSLPSRSS